MNPFGPQGANAVKSLPSGTKTLRYGTADTWFKDCSASGANDATVLDAAFLNNLIGNLYYLLTAAGLTGITRGDMTLVYRAIVAIKATYTAGAGIVIDETVIKSAVGTGKLPRLTA